MTYLRERVRKQREQRVARRPSDDPQRIGARSGGLRLHWLEYETAYVHIWITRIMIRL